MSCGIPKRMQRFGPFEIDFVTSELRKSGVRIRIQDQSLRILEALLERPGQMVTRDQLRDRLWPSDTFVDFERSMNAAIAKLRQTLSDSAARPLYVETVARKGYRFIAPVTGPNPSTSTEAETIAVSPPTPTPVPPERLPANQHRLTFGLLLLTGLMAAALLTIFLSRPNDSDKSMIWLDIDTRGDASQPAISSDGTRIVFVSGGKLVVRRLDQTQLAPLAGTEGAASPFLSPDGQSIGYFADHKLKVVPLDGGESLTLCAAPLNGGGTWMEDGRIVAAINPSGELSVIASKGGTPVEFTSLKGEPPGITQHSQPRSLPGGKGVLFIAGGGLSTGALRIMSNNGAQKTLISDVSTGRYLASGHLFYQRGGTVFAAPMSLTSFSLTGPETPLVEGVATDFLQGADFDVSTTGTAVYRKGPQPQKRMVVALDAAGIQDLVIAKRGAFVSPRLSPDSKRLALASASEGPQTIWIHDLERKTTTPLNLNNGQIQCCPVWSPDGRYIAFSLAAPGGGSTVTLVKLDGNQVVGTLPAVNRNFAVPFSFSSDGKWLFYHSDLPTTGYDILAVSVDWTSGTPRLGQPRPLVRRAGLQTSPSISPDGRYLAYSSDESGRFEVYVIPFSPEDSTAKGKWQLTAEGGRSPRWSPWGNTIFYRSSDEHLMAVEVKTTANSLVAERPKQWFGRRLASVGAPPNFDVVGNGNKIVAILDDEDAKPDETHLRIILNVVDQLRRRNGRGR